MKKELLIRLALLLTLLAGGASMKAGTVVWDAGNGVWDTTTLNWRPYGVFTGVLTNYANGDAVIFDDTASGSSPITITLSSTVDPLSVTASNMNKSYIFTGAGSIAGSAGLTLSEGGTITLEGVNSYTGGTIINASQLNINNGGVDAGTAIGTGPLTINAGSVLDNTSGAAVTLSATILETWNGNFTFIGSGALDMGKGAVTLGGGVNVTVISNALVVGPVTDDGAGYGLTKSGPGVLGLTGGGAYLGPTAVVVGSLVCLEPLASPTISISAGAILDVSAISGGQILASNGVLSGSGTVNGSISDNPGVFIYPGGIDTAGTLTVNSNLTFNGGGTVVFDLTNTNTVGDGTNDLLVVGGTLNIAGPTTFSINPLAPIAGTYTVISYGSFAGSMTNINVPAGFTVTNNTSLGAIQISGTEPLVIVHQPASLSNQAAGSDVSVCVAAQSSNTNGLTYQWLKNGNIIPPTDTNFLAATSSCLQVNNLQATDGGAFSVMVSDGVNVVVSQVADVTVVGAGITLLGTTRFVSNAVPLPSVSQFTIRSSNTNLVKQPGTPDIIPNDPGGSEIWYQWSVPDGSSDGIMTMSTLGSDFDTTLGAYTSPSPGQVTPVLTAINDDDAAGYLNSLMSFYAVQGTMYLIAVDGFFGAQGNVVLSGTFHAGSDSLPTNSGTPVDIVASNNATVILTSPWLSNNCNWLFNGQAIATNLPSLTISNLSPDNTGAYIASLTTPHGSTINSEPILVQINLQQDGSTDTNSLIRNKFQSSTNDNFTPPGGGMGQVVKLGGDTGGYSDSQTFSIADGCVSEPYQPLLCTGNSCCANWYTYTAPTAGTLEVSTVNAATDFPTIIGVFLSSPVNSYGFPSTLAGCGTYQNKVQPSVYVNSISSGQELCVMVQPMTGSGNACDSGNYNLSLYFASCDLNITKSASTIDITWPLACGTNLQSSASPKGPWTAVSSAIVKGSSGYSCSLPVAPGNLFFTLQ